MEPNQYLKNIRSQCIVAAIYRHTVAIVTSTMLFYLLLAGGVVSGFTPQYLLSVVSMTHCRINT